MTAKSYFEVLWMEMTTMFSLFGTAERKGR
jgi:hypothetical protein